MQPSHQPAVTRSADIHSARVSYPHALHAFLNPHGDNMQQVRSLLQDVLNQTIDDLSAARELPTVPTEWANIPTDKLLPQSPASPAELVSACRDMLRGSMNPAHPRYLGHMDPLPSTSSIAASLITAAVNNNLLSREMSPLFSELEQRLLHSLAGLFGLPETAGGMLQSGGSLCNLQALTVARNVHFDVHTQGLAGISSPPVLFASERCHSSVQKAAMVLGLGTEAVIAIPTDARGKLRIDALEQELREARRSGKAPFAVVATAGTTVTGNIDPLPEVADLCERENLWMHVDASYGGAMVFSDQHRPRLSGIERADSVTFNPQKWCYVTKACALVLFRDEQVLDRAFRIAAPYMSLNEEHGHVNLGEWGIQGTRAPDIAKWWLTLLQLGQSGLEELIGHSFRLTELLLSELREREYLEIATPPEMNIVCFRDCRAGDDEAARGEWNARLQPYLMATADTFFSLPYYRDSRWLKAVVLNPFTTANDFAEIFSAIDRFNGE